MNKLINDDSWNKKIFAVDLFVEDKYFHKSTNKNYKAKISQTKQNC